MSYRFERKFLARDCDTPSLHLLLRSSKYSFFQCYDDRVVNNIYFDSPSFDSYRQAINGSFDREKLRLRWYDDDYDASFLEAKIKRGRVGTKVSSNVNNLRELLESNDFRLRSLSLENPECLGLLLRCRQFLPVLANRYHRSYYLSDCKLYRATVDTKVEYKFPRDLLNENRFKIKSHQTVLEIKYENEMYLDLDLSLDNMPWRISKNSKYTNGITLLYFAK